MAASSPDPSTLEPRSRIRETFCGNRLLSIGFGQRREAWWISVRGELDRSTAPILEPELLACEARDDRPITIDLSALTFMDVAGLRLLLDASSRSRAHKNRLGIVRGPRAVQRVVELTGSEALLPFTDRLATPRHPSVQADTRASVTASLRRTVRDQIRGRRAVGATRGQPAPQIPSDSHRTR